MSADMTQDSIGTATAAAGNGARRLRWPGDPDGIAAADIDFEALAHVLANSCRWGGRTRRYHSLAAHAVVVSEEIEALDGLADEDRRALALHALLADAPVAWLRGAPGASQRAAERMGRLAAGVERAVRAAAGLDAVLGDEQAELLRFVARMADAASAATWPTPTSRGTAPLPATQAPHPAGRAGPRRPALARTLPRTRPAARRRRNGRGRRRDGRREPRCNRRKGARRCHAPGADGRTERNPPKRARR